MKRKFLLVLLAIISAIVCAFGISACTTRNDDSSNSNSGGATGIYYLYENNKLDKSQYIKIESNKWSDDDNVSGTYKVSGTSITFYSEVFGSNEEMYSGTLSDGKLTIKVLGSTMTYYKEGKEPAGGNPNTHNWATTWSSDDDYHWYACTDCNEKKDYAAHYFVDGECVCGKKGTSTNPPSKKEFEVTFNLNYAGASLVKYNTENHLVTFIPTRSGYEFNGWYLDSDLLRLFDSLSNEVTAEGLTLYASWVEEATEAGQLSAPVVSVSENVFSWKKVAGATGYRIVVSLTGSKEDVIDESTKNTSWTFPEKLDAGKYTVKIRAIGDGITTVNSVYSSKSFALRVLGNLTGIAFDKATSLLSWDEVVNAEEYQIYIGNKLIASQLDTTLSLSNYDAGNLTIKIVAVKENWLSSYNTANISKMRLKTPEVTITINADTHSYELSWDSVLYADTYILKSGDNEIELKSTSYTISNDSSLWDNNALSFTINAFDSKADYLISSGAKEHTINKIFNLQIDESLNNAGDIQVEGNIWMPVIVSFDLNGASGSIPSQTITTTKGLTYPEIPTRSGYIFRGWFTEKSCENVYDFTTAVEKSITLYAGWFSTSNRTFKELNSGSSSYSSSSSYRYTYFRALSGSQIRIGYSQTSSNTTSYMLIYDVTKDELWSDEQSFRNTTPGTTTFYPSAGHVYYVRTRSSASTNINLSFTTYPSDTYLPNDGGRAKTDYILSQTSSALTNLVVCNKEYTITATTKSGYAWLGWYNGETELTKELSYTFTMPAENVTYTAKWIECPVTLEKNISNAGTISGLDGATKVGESVTITATTNDGYTWLGWYNGETELTKELSYTFTMPAENVTYTAKWAYYTVTTEKNYNDAGKVTSYTDTKFTVGKKVTITATTNDGYTWLGWYNGETELTKELSYTFTMAPENVTYTAKWAYYTVTADKNYDDAGTITPYDGKKVTVGKSITVTATTNEGYNWLGWYNGETKLTDELSYTFTMSAENVLYTAKWSYYTVSVISSEGGRVEYVGSAVVKFDLNGGVGEIPNQKVSIRTGIAFPKTIPTKDGYVFRGWFTDSDCTTYFDFSAPVMKDITLYAGWQSVYKNLSSSVSKSSMNIIDTVSNYNGSGNAYSFSTSTSGGRHIFFPVYKTGEYKFYYKNSSSSSSYRAAITLYNQTQSSNSYTPSTYCTSTSYNSVTFTANAGDVFMVWGWKGDTYASTVSFYLTGNEYPVEGGTYEKSMPAKVSVGEEVTLQATTNAGYSWLGWYNGETELTKELSYTFTMPAENVTYIAKWIECPVILEKNINDAGNVSGLEGSTEVGKSVTITATTNDGYTWLGWYNGETELTKELSYTFTMPAENVTYTAKWAYYTVTTERNDSMAGTVTSYSNTKITVGDIVTITATTNDGYTFVGWHNGETELTKELSYTFAMPADNVTYTAKWIKVNTECDLQDAGNVTSLNGTYRVGDEVTITATTNDGYTFVGWYNGEIELTKELSYTFTMPAENVTYTAKWTVYTLTVDCTDGGGVGVKVYFDLNGASGIAPEAQNVTASNGLKYPNNIPTRDGYIFAGWYDNAQCAGSPYDFTAKLMSSITLYAKWLDYSASGIIPINGNITVQVESKSSSSKNYYAIVPLVSGSISVYSANGLSDTYGYLYNSNKSQLTTDDDGGDGNNFKITYNVTAGTLYYVVPCGYSSSGTTTVYFSASLPADGGTSNSQSTVAEGTTNITAGKSVVLKASTDLGYTFVGWYNGETELTKELNYTFTMPAANIVYTAKWVKVNIESNSAEAGSVTLLNGTYKAGDEVTVTAITNNSYTFVGWYNGETELTKELNYTFTMPSENVTYTAKWAKITVSQNLSSAGSITSLDGTYKQGNQVTISATTNLGYTWLGWYNGETEITKELSYTFTMPAESATYTAKWIVDSRLANIDFTSDTSTCTVTSVNDTSLTEIIIPDYVTSIKAGAFKGCSSLERLTLPFIGGGIKTANDKYQYPFGYIFGTSSYAGGTSVIQSYYGSSTTSKTSGAYYIPASLREVVITGGNVLYGAFNNCSMLSKITILSDVDSIGSSVFSGCTSLTNVGIPSSVTTIGSLAFSGCKSLTNFVLPSNLTSIENSTFNGCSSLANIVIPSNVTSIGSSAFNGCSAFTNIVIPSNVTSIGSSAFSGCSNLESITLPFVGSSIKTSSDTYQYTFGYIFGTTSYNGGVEVQQQYYGSSTSSTTSVAYYIPSSLREVSITGGNILYGAFYNCSMLTDIELPDTISRIESFAFYQCGTLTDISFPANIESIGERAFYGCKAFTNLVIPNNIVTIEREAFEYCVSIVVVSLGTNLDSIASSAFYGCTSLIEVCNKSKLTIVKDTSNGYVGYYAQNIYTPISGASKLITTIPGLIFYCGDDGQYSLIKYNGKEANLILPESINNNGYSIAKDAFNQCNTLKEIVITSNVNSIESMAFYMCKALTCVTIKAGVSNINTGAFSGCNALEQIIVDEDNSQYVSVDGILYDKAKTQFICIPIGLTGSVTIPDTITTIGLDVFSQCSSLTSLTIGAGVTSIESTFRGCKSLAEILVDPDNQYFKSVDGNLYNKSGTTLIKYAIGKTNTSFSVPKGVYTIGDSAFAYCTSLKSVSMSNNTVQTMGTGVFRECTSLTSVTLSTALTAISSNAFAKCTALTGITIPSKVTTIGSYAFEGCTAIKSITIPSNVTTIESYAFYGCSSLKSATFSNTSWKATYRNTSTDLSSYLASPSVAAEYLTKEYYLDKWTRK